MAEPKNINKKARKKTYALPIGPQHPALLESENLEVFLDGEVIDDVKINVGYLHRGIERALQNRNYIQGIYLAERICGICMPGEHEIILKDGSIIKLSEFIDKKIPEKANPIISLSANGNSVMAYNGTHTKPKNITAVQKVKCPSKLFKIKTLSGTELIFTGDHPIMIDTTDGPRMIKVKYANPGERVYSPRKIEIRGIPIRIVDCLPEEFKIILNEEYYAKLSLKIRKGYDTLMNFAKKTGINPWRMQRMRDKLRIYELKKICEFMGLDWVVESDNIEEVSNSGLKIKLKEKYVTEEMMNILGLLASNGYFGNTRGEGGNFNHRITFVNKQKVLISKVERFHRKLFPDKLAKKFIMSSTVPAIRLSNPVLTFVARKLGLNALDRKTTDIKEIFKLPEKHIAAFLRGYFDGDGACRRGEIIYYTSDSLMAKRLRLLLKRVGIASSLSFSASKGFKKGTRWSVSITNKHDLLSFIEKINSYHPIKKKRLKEMKKYCKRKTYHSKFQLAPLKAGPLLRSIRKKYRIKPDEIGACSDIYKIEKKGKNVMKWRIKKYVDIIRKKADRNDKHIKELDDILSDRFFIDPIKEIEMIDSECEHVYDLTVDEAHNFIPEGGFVVGNCSGHHSVSYCQAIENLLDLNIPERSQYIRTIIMELERIHSHMLWAGVAAHEIGFDTLFQIIWRDREYVMEILEELTGNRVNYSMVTIGGVRRDIPNAKIPHVLKIVDKLEDRIIKDAKVLLNDKILLTRTSGIGLLSRSNAEALSIVGPMARASGVRYDIREEHPFAAYGLVPWSVTSDNGCDIQSRIRVRTKELLQSTRIIKGCLNRLPKTKKETNTSRPVGMIPENEAMSRSEAPRGELVYYARSNGTDHPERIKIRTPTYSNLLALGPMLKGQFLADLPLIVASLDPCFSCTDRVALIDTSTWDRKSFNEQGLRKEIERRGGKK